MASHKTAGSGPGDYRLLDTGDVENQRRGIELGDLLDDRRRRAGQDYQIHICCDQILIGVGGLIDR